MTHWTIRTRILASFAFILAVILLTAVVAYDRQSAIQTHANALRDDALPGLYYSTAMRGAWGETYVLAWQSVTAANDAERRQYAEANSALLKRLDGLEAKYADSIRRADDRERFEKYRELRRHYDNVSASLFAATGPEAAAAEAKLRGPIHAAVLNGETESGLTVMYMDAGLDTGDVLREHCVRLRRRETAGSLHDRLAELAPAALLGALDELSSGRAPRTPQDVALATVAPKLERESGRIDWTRDHQTLDRFVRGMHPWPGAWTLLPATPRALTLKIHSVLPVRRLRGAPGEMIRQTARGVYVAAGGGGGLLLREVQLEGKRRLHAAEFARGHALPPGLRLG